MSEQAPDQTTSKRKLRISRKQAVVAIVSVLVLCALCAIVAEFLPESDDAEVTQVSATTNSERSASIAGGSPVPKSVDTSEPTDTPESVNTSAPTDTPAPTNTPEPTNTPTVTLTPSITPTPTNTPLPTETPIPTSTPTPLAITGTGQTATDSIVLPSGIYRTHFTHSGSRNFAVWIYMGDSKDLLVNEIGPYDGYQLVVGGQSVMFDITADGAWMVEFVPIHAQVGAAFEGRGDDVSGLFDPPSTGAWVFRHDGSSNFAVWLNCVGGTDLVQNEIGPVDASGVVQFARGPCLWQVTADGSWSLAPRQ